MSRSMSADERCCATSTPASAQVSSSRCSAATAPVRRRCFARSPDCIASLGGAFRSPASASAQLRALDRAKRLAFVTGDEVFLEALLVRDVVSIGRFAHHRWWQWNAAPADDDAVDRALAAVRIERLRAAALFDAERRRTATRLDCARSRARDADSAARRAHEPSRRAALRTRFWRCFAG